MGRRRWLMRRRGLMRRRWLTWRRWRWLAFPALVALAVGLLGVGVRATNGGSAAVDEPQYLLTALSLWEDHDLDISDELAAQRWRAYHQGELPVQTEALAGGRAVSPHDPLLPVLLAVPVGVGGWVGAKAAMALIAAACAALLSFVAARRFGIDERVAGIGAAIAFASPPLGIYSQQIYPEVPAALAVLVTVAALSAPRLTVRHLAVAGTGIAALPWLGLKYAPVAALLALGGAFVARRRISAPTLLRAGAGLGLAAIAWLGGHRLLYGGWTSYATGDQFQATGELSVVGVDPDYVGRSLRLVGLLADDTFGLVPWQPLYAVLVAAVAVLAARGPLHGNAPRARSSGRSDATWLLLAPLAAGWATATWVALTMHGFWSPGRQVVVVLPLAVIVVMLALQRLASASRRRMMLWGTAGALAAAGVASMAALLVAGWQGSLTWVTGFEAAPSPVYQAIRAVTPDYRGDHFVAGHLAWIALLAASVAIGLRLTRDAGTATASASAPAPAPSPATPAAPWPAAPWPSAAAPSTLPETDVHPKGTLV